MTQYRFLVTVKTDAQFIRFEGDFPHSIDATLAGMDKIQDPHHGRVRVQQIGGWGGGCVGRKFFESEWTPTEKDNKMHELAERYHREAEAYDRTVCSGPIRDGSVIPIGPHERALVGRNAANVRERIMAEAANEGISAEDMRRAIVRHA